MKSFHGKTAAITGAGSGIGRALALELARRKCDLALCDVNEAGLKRTADEARGLGVRVLEQRVDVAKRDEVHAWADAALQYHGKMNLVVNNAGVALVTTVEGASYEELEWIMGINYWGVIYGTKAFLPHLKASGEGHIVNISSVFGLFGCPSQCGYNSAKFAVRGFTECLRQELDIMNCGVSATSVHPGGIKTNIARAARDNNTCSVAFGMERDEDGQNFEKTARTTPEQAAIIILRAVEKNKRRVMVGPDAHIFDWMTRLMPATFQAIVPAILRRTTRARATN